MIYDHYAGGLLAELFEKAMEQGERERDRDHYASFCSILKCQASMFPAIPCPEIWRLSHSIQTVLHFLLRPVPTCNSTSHTETTRLQEPQHHCFPSQKQHPYTFWFLCAILTCASVSSACFGNCSWAGAWLVEKVKMDIGLQPVQMAWFARTSVGQPL